MAITRKEEIKNSLLKELAKCRKCRVCVDVCPVYQVSERLETNSPYGCVQVLRFLLNKALSLDDSVVYPIYTCLQCGRCSIVCKKSGGGMEVSDLIRLGKSLLFEDIV